MSSDKEGSNFFSDYLKNQTKFNSNQNKDEENYKLEAEKIQQEFNKNPIKVILEPNEKEKDATATNNTSSSKSDENIELRQTVEMNKYRKEKIKDMALENCSEYESEVYQCLRNGSWQDRLKMCFDQYNVFWDCVNKQKTVLESIGYGRPSNSPHIDAQLAEAGYDIVLLERQNENKSQNKNEQESK